MNDNGWVKLFRKAPYDSKLRSISAGRRWVFVSYLCAAEPLGKWRGYLVNGEGSAMSLRQRADVAGIDHSAALRAERELIELDLLQQTSFGLKVKNFAKYQGNGVVHRTPGNPTGGAQNTTTGAQNTTGGAESGAQNTKSGAQTGADNTIPRSTLPPKNKEDIEEEEEGRTVFLPVPYTLAALGSAGLYKVPLVKAYLSEFCVTAIPNNHRKKLEPELVTLSEHPLYMTALGTTEQCVKCIDRWREQAAPDSEVKPLLYIMRWIAGVITKSAGGQ